MLIGCMMWRIGEVVDLFAQLRWLRERRFDAVAFWTCAGQPGVWQGFDFGSATHDGVPRLQSALAGFQAVDLHADVPLADEPTLRRLRHIITFGAELGARTVTVHPEADAAWLREALLSLDEAAERADLRVGLELTRHYDLAMCSATPRVGLTLDVGHVSFEGGAGYREFGSLAGLIEHMGDRLFHVHAHDYDGALDHLPLGAGHLDFDAIASALKRVGYSGVVCLELNPDRATPEQLLASRDRLQQLLG
jgi:sugar phosphate isomerase/epimerase